MVFLLTTQIIDNLAPLHSEVKLLSSRGVRVIALATSAVAVNPEDDSLTAPLDLIGFIGLRDEVREEARSALNTCKSAGIQVVMVTGDRKETAISIAREVNLFPTAVNPAEDFSDRHLPRNSVLTSEEMNLLSNDELAAIMPEVRTQFRM